MNKFILVPADLYKGLTEFSPTGNPNLDFIKRTLDQTRRERTDPSTKITKYNQQLRRYLNIKRENEEKPVKVEISKDGPWMLYNKSKGRLAYEDDDEDETDEDDWDVTEASAASATPKTHKPLTSTPMPHSRPMPTMREAIDVNERVEQLFKIFNGNPEKYRVRGDHIFNRRGLPVKGSSLRASIRYLINQRARAGETGKTAADKRKRKPIQPTGTIYIREFINKDPILKAITNPKAGSKKFSPLLWK